MSVISPSLVSKSLGIIATGYRQYNLTFQWLLLNYYRIICILTVKTAQSYFV